MYTCDNCDAFVSRDFVRVFGDADDRIFGCPSCSTAPESARGPAPPRQAATD
jgi:hypothetical protein